MGYGYYEISRPDGQAMKRGYQVGCKCHKRGCKEKIDRGMAYLCYSCTWYFCEKHRASAYCDKHDKPIEIECFTGASNQMCERCAKIQENYYRKNGECDDAHNV